MRIAFSHNNADSDGFAALVGLRLLYPGLRIVLGQRVSPRVRNVLALHREFVDPLFVNEVDFDEVTLAIVADVRRASRLAEYAPLFERHDGSGQPEIHVFDHHGASDDDIAADHTCIERVGATCTLVTRELQRANITPGSIEATLLALGIHTDTGSLTYATTTQADAAAFGWLLEQGANVGMIERFVRLSLTDDQRFALTRLMESMQVEEYSGMPVAIAGVTLERSVNGLAFVVSQALRLSGHPALIAVFHIGGRKVQVIARSRLPEVDVGAVVRTVGGGGHAAAAAATIKTRDPFPVVASIRDVLQRNLATSRRAHALADDAIATIDASASLAAAGEALNAQGREVLAVQREGELVGWVDRAFVRAAARDGRHELPVASSMHHGVVRVPAALPLDQLIERVIAADVPAVFLEEEGVIRAWVTRQRLLDALYNAPSEAIESEPDKD